MAGGRQFRGSTYNLVAAHSFRRFRKKGFVGFPLLSICCPQSFGQFAKRNVLLNSPLVQVPAASRHFSGVTAPGSGSYHASWKLSRMTAPGARRLRLRRTNSRHSQRKRYEAFSCAPSGDQRSMETRKLFEAGVSARGLIEPCATNTHESVW